MKRIFLYVFAGLFIFSSSAWAVQGFGNKGGVVNKTLTLANSEVAVTLPNDTDSITLQSRTAADFRVAFTTLGTYTTYYTVKSGAVWSSPVLGLTNTGDATLQTTIFLQSATAGQIVEILYFE